MTVKKMGLHNAASSSIGCRLPKQVQRILMLAVACFLCTIFFTNTDIFGSSLNPTHLSKAVLSLHSPRSTHDEFPRQIWQTWMVNSLFFDKRESTRVRTWMTMNPGHRYEVLTDDNALAYVEAHFGPAGFNRPDILYVFQSLTIKIIKADFLRYLVMYTEGGVYADIDVEALKPINKFIPQSLDFNEADLDMVVGIEVDEPSFDFHPILGPKCASFCQWTFMSKPRSPAILRLINGVISWLDKLSRAQNVPIANLTVSFDDVIKGTGPSAFTKAMLSEMAGQTGQTITWDSFHGLTEPKRVGNILVLPINAFAAGQDHSNSGDHNSEAAMVKHHYHATGWTDSFSRYSHPAYGMVEECSWNMDCVKKWDANTAAFPSLPEEQQKKLITDHENYWKEVAAKEAAEREAADKKAAEKKEADKKEADAKAAEKKKADFKALEKKIEEKKAELKRAEDKQAEDKNAEKKKAEDKQAEDKRAADKKAEDKKSEDQRAQDKKAEDKKAEDKKERR